MGNGANHFASPIKKSTQVNIFTPKSVVVIPAETSSPICYTLPNRSTSFPQCIETYPQSVKLSLIRRNHALIRRHRSALRFLARPSVALVCLISRTSFSVIALGNKAAITYPSSASLCNSASYAFRRTPN